jgi:hypothetical protein
LAGAASFFLQTIFGAHGFAYFYEAYVNKYCIGYLAGGRFPFDPVMNVFWYRSRTRLGADICMGKFFKSYQGAHQKWCLETKNGTSIIKDIKAAKRPWKLKLRKSKARLTQFG